MALIEINNNNYQQEIMQDKGFKLIIFGANWCGPCKLFAPVVQEVAAENPDLKICANDVDISTSASRKFEIMSVPTIVVMNDGVEQARLVGAQNKERLLEIIRQYQ